MIDTELQRKIANTEMIDYNAVEAIKGLLGEGPNQVKKDLEDWEVEEFKGKTYCSIKERTTFRMMANFDTILYRNIMTI